MPSFVKLGVIMPEGVDAEALTKAGKEAESAASAASAAAGRKTTQQKTTVECTHWIAGWLLISRKCLSELLGPACGRLASSSSSERHFLELRSQPAIQQVHSTVVFCCE